MLTQYTGIHHSRLHQRANEARTVHCDFSAQQHVRAGGETDRYLQSESHDEERDSREQGLLGRAEEGSNEGGPAQGKRRVGMRARRESACRGLRIAWNTVGNEGMPGHVGSDEI